MKRKLALLLAMIMSFTAFPVQVFSLDAEAQVAYQLIGQEEQLNTEAAAPEAQEAEPGELGVPEAAEVAEIEAAEESVSGTEEAEAAAAEVSEGGESESGVSEAEASEDETAGAEAAESEASEAERTENEIEAGEDSVSDPAAEGHESDAEGTSEIAGSGEFEAAEITETEISEAETDTEAEEVSAGAAAETSAEDISAGNSEASVSTESAISSTGAAIDTADSAVTGPAIEATGAAITTGAAVEASASAIETTGSSIQTSGSAITGAAIETTGSAVTGPAIITTEAAITAGAVTTPGAMLLTPSQMPTEGAIDEAAVIPSGTVFYLWDWNTRAINPDSGISIPKDIQTMINGYYLDSDGVLWYSCEWHDFDIVITTSVYVRAEEIEFGALPQPVASLNTVLHGVSISVEALGEPFSADTQILVSGGVTNGNLFNTDRDLLIYRYNLALSSGQPEGPVRVSLEGVDLYEEDGYFVVHVLDDEEAIIESLEAGRAQEANIPEFVAQYPEESQLAYEISGEEDIVYIEVFAPEDDTLQLEDGVLSFVTNSFSDYYVVSGISTNGPWGMSTQESGNPVIAMRDNTQNRIMYLAPGTTITFVRDDDAGLSNRKIDWGFESVSGASHEHISGIVRLSLTPIPVGSMTNIGSRWDSDDNFATITIDIDAVADESIILKNNSNGGSPCEVKIIVRSQQDIIENTLQNSVYPLRVGVVLDSRSIPSEPYLTGKASKYDYGWYQAGSTGVKRYDSVLEILASPRNFAADTGTYIVSDIPFNSNLVSSIDGTNTVGIQDDTGVKVKEVLNGFDWGAMLDIAANDTHNVWGTETGYFTASDGTNITNSTKANYEVVPYIVKLQTSYEVGWYVLCSIQPKGSVVLSYDPNFPEGLTLGGSGDETNSIEMPASVSGLPPLSATVGAIKYNGSNVTATTQIKLSNGKTMTFLGWSTTPGGNVQYVSGSSITGINQNAVLYAKWNVDMPGDLKIVNDVVLNGSTRAVPDSFSYSITGGSDLTGKTYAKYDADGTPVGSGTVGTSGLTIELTGGQYVIISNINNDTAYVVTQTDHSDYTKTAPANASGSIAGGFTTTVSFTNTEKTVTISYVSATPEYGSVSTESETLGVINQPVSGSTASAISGYKLDAWYSDNAYTDRVSTDIHFVPSKPSADTTYYAKFVPDKRTVSYSYTGTVPAGAPAAPEDTQESCGAAVNVAAAPTMTGYTFSGWSTGDVSVVSGRFTMPDADVAFTGSWSPKTDVWYTVSYIEKGTSTTIAAVKTVENRTFASTVTEGAIAGIEGFTLADDSVKTMVLDEYGKELVFKYTRNSHTVTYMADGSVYTTQAGIYGKPVSLPADPQKEYHDFAGWYEDPELTTAWTIPVSMPDEDIIVYGKFVQQTNSLTICKSGMAAGQNCIFTVTGGHLGSTQLRVVISGSGSGSVTISGLHVGKTYTVTEDTGWSYAYICSQASKSITISNKTDSFLLSFVNVPKSEPWITDEDRKKNVFGKA